MEQGSVEVGDTQRFGLRRASALTMGDGPSVRFAVPRRRARPRPRRRTAACSWSARSSGHAGQYPTIQSAVDGARSGDWILVAPGDYHENDDTTGPASEYVSSGGFGGVYITKSNIHVRGMNRNSVIVDGTKPGATACSADPNDQTYGRTRLPVAQPDGRNGIVVWKADRVSIDNLTVCNFLAGSEPSGNEIWWNGGADRARPQGRLPDEREPRLQGDDDRASERCLRDRRLHARCCRDQSEGGDRDGALERLSALFHHREGRVARHNDKVHFFHTRRLPGTLGCPRAGHAARNTAPRSECEHPRLKRMRAWCASRAL